MRFADTAERRHGAGKYRDLLDDLDGDAKSDFDFIAMEMTAAPHTGDTDVDIFDEHSME